eukprot:jgi/Tetstr1/457059/TSEL_043722.t1
MEGTRSGNQLRVTSLNIKLMALLHAAGQSKPLGRLQRHIYWLNSLGLPHGMLVNGAADLADGRALEEAIDHLLGGRAGECPGEGGGGGFQDLRAALGAEEPHLAAPSPRVRAAALPSALSTTLVGTRATGAVPDRRGPPSGTPSLRHLMATRSSDCAQLDARDRLGLARALDSTSIEVDDSVRIGSQNTAGAAASGVASSNLAAASSHGRGALPVPAVKAACAGFPAAPVRRVIRTPEVAEQRDREEDRENRARRRRALRRLVPEAADLVARSCFCHRPRTLPSRKRGRGGGQHQQRIACAISPPFPPSSPAGPGGSVATAALQQPAGRADFRLAEASDQEMEAVAESLSGPSSPRRHTAPEGPPQPPPRRRRH